MTPEILEGLPDCKRDYKKAHDYWAIGFATAFVLSVLAFLLFF